jgi:hypothetical protein
MHIRYQQIYERLQRLLLCEILGRILIQRGSNCSLLGKNVCMPDGLVSRAAEHYSEDPLASCSRSQPSVTGVLKIHLK